MLLLLIAFETVTQGDPLLFFLNFGTLGVMFVLMLTGIIYTKPYVQRLERELQDKDNVITLLTAQLSQHTIPALAQTTRILEAVPNTEATLLEELRKVNEAIGRLEKP